MSGVVLGKERWRCFLYLWILVILLLDGCTKNFVPDVSLKGGLPADKLAFYSDSFDRLRDDIWETTWYTWSKAQMENFKSADIYIEAGRLKIRTKTGAFSKASLITKYYFRGDFDFQIDCHFDFLDQDVNMDQILLFIVLERGKKLDNADLAAVILEKTPGSYNGEMRFVCRRWWKEFVGGGEEISGFRGTLRFIRTGRSVTTMYKRTGADRWKTLGSCLTTDRDVSFGFSFGNFFRGTRTIDARTSIWVTFDNFRINAAQGIVEEEI